MTVLKFLIKQCWQIAALSHAAECAVDRVVGNVLVAPLTFRHIRNLTYAFNDNKTNMLIRDASLIVIPVQLALALVP